ncbi:MAG TPA: SGNH/GDSL hydrolase family protein [Candidatus Polarisedimenticolia bacterium]|nr:SGNH/GDSL hydrolase family protein [Candidatus Polarisedimenticolia bacterium]
MRTPGVAAEGGDRSLTKLRLYGCLALTASTVAAIAILEIVLRLFYPQDTLSPRWAYSPHYCTTAYPGARMVHERPGRWRFVYTINADGNRGPRLSLPRSDAKPLIVVLGDSYSFGAGVADGEEYSEVLERDLHGAAHVLNLALGGWGLTQEIRRYYDFGALYDPRVVILQFSANDPEDNLKCPVAQLRDGRFVFHDSHAGVFRIKDFLSRSLIQKSQIYNLVRDRLYRLMAGRVIERSRADLAKDGATAGLDETNHAQLLEAFARDLHARGVRLLLVTVNGQLREFPRIEEKVRQLEAEGQLRFFDAADWLEGEQDYASPEGHLWGTRAHRVLGERLAGIVAGLTPTSAGAPGS